jgi:hypothetical protein
MNSCHTAEWTEGVLQHTGQSCTARQWHFQQVYHSVRSDGGVRRSSLPSNQGPLAAPASVPQRTCRWWGKAFFFSSKQPRPLSNHQQVYHNVRADGGVRRSSSLPSSQGPLATTSKCTYPRAIDIHDVAAVKVRWQSSWLGCCTR